MLSFTNNNSDRSNPNNLNGEYFGDTDCKLTSNNVNISCPAGSHFLNAYGNICIDSTKLAVHQWIFKLGKMKFNETYIGIVETSVNKSQGIFTETGKGYAYGPGEVIIPISGKIGYEFIDDKPVFKEGDMLIMIERSRKQISLEITS